MKRLKLSLFVKNQGIPDGESRVYPERNAIFCLH